MLFDFIYHGQILANAYNETAELWRPVEEMNKYLPFTLINTFVYAFVLTIIFKIGYKGGGIKEGLRFGVLVGILVGICLFSFYAYMPMTYTVALAWLLGTILQTILAGIVLSKIIKK